MKSEIVGTRHFLRIERGEEIVATITEYIQQKKIRAGSIQAIGAATDITLSFYSLERKAYETAHYDGEYEILSILGNVSEKEGALWPHLHVVLSDDQMQCIGGHLNSATVSVTCEVQIEEVDTVLKRSFDEETGLQLWDI